MEKTNFDVTVAGHPCLDMIPPFLTDRESASISQLLQPGTLVHMGAMTLCTGGAGSHALSRYQ